MGAQEQEANAQKQSFREAAEARRREAMRRKAEEEKNRAAEQERIRAQEIEKGNKLRAELERKKAERGPIIAQAMKSQDDRAKREAAAAKVKVCPFFSCARTCGSVLIGRRQRKKRLGKGRWHLRSTSRLLFILERGSRLGRMSVAAPMLMVDARHSVLLPV